MAPWHPRHTRRAITKGLISLVITICILHYFQLLDFLSVRRYDTWTWTACSGSVFEPSCLAPRAKIAQDVLVVIKTGGSEPQSRLQAQLSTILSELPRQNILIFSDIEEQVDSHHVYDAYADLSNQERTSYPEFALYEAQQEVLGQGLDIRENEWLQGGWDLAK